MQLKIYVNKYIYENKYESRQRKKEILLNKKNYQTNVFKFIKIYFFLKNVW